MHSSIHALACCYFLRNTFTYTPKTFTYTNTLASFHRINYVNIHIYTYIYTHTTATAFIIAKRIHVHADTLASFRRILLHHHNSLSLLSPSFSSFSSSRNSHSDIVAFGQAKAGCAGKVATEDMGIVCDGPGIKVTGTSAYAYECCMGDMCNAGTPARVDSLEAKLNHALPSEAYCDDMGGRYTNICIHTCVYKYTCTVYTCVYKYVYTCGM